MSPLVAGTDAAKSSGVLGCNRLCELRRAAGPCRLLAEAAKQVLWRRPRNLNTPRRPFVTDSLRTTSGGLRHPALRGPEYRTPALSKSASYQLNAS